MDSEWDFCVRVHAVQSLFMYIKAECTSSATKSKVLQGNSFRCPCETGGAGSSVMW